MNVSPAGRCDCGVVVAYALARMLLVPIDCRVGGMGVGSGAVLSDGGVHRVGIDIEILRAKYEAML